MLLGLILQISFAVYNLIRKKYKVDILLYNSQWMFDAQINSRDKLSCSYLTLTFI